MSQSREMLQDRQANRDGKLAPEYVNMAGYTDTSRKKTHHRVRECGRLYRHRRKKKQVT
jgi:hypothetical protein